MQNIYFLSDYTMTMILVSSNATSMTATLTIAALTPVDCHATALTIAPLTIAAFTPCDPFATTNCSSKYRINFLRLIR